MEHNNTESIALEEIASIPFYRNSLFTEILKFVFDQCETEKEINNIILSFEGKFGNDILHEEDYDTFHAICVHLLDYVHKRNGPTQGVVSRSLNCYMKLTNLCTEEGLNTVINYRDNTFVTNLREFTDFSSPQGEDILMDALIQSVFHGKFGLTLFLLKFGLVEIPSVVNRKSKKLVGELVDMFNDSIQYIFANDEAEGSKTSIHLDELLDLMRQSGINIRRSLMTFMAVVVISEYRFHERLEMDTRFHNEKEALHKVFVMRLLCLYQIFDATAEAKIAYKDIEAFIVKFINPLLDADFGRSLIQFSRQMLCSTFDPLNPRSLQDLTRCTIRSNLQKFSTFPEQVDQLHLPLALKNFLIFDCEGGFDLPEVYYDRRYYEQHILPLLERLVTNLPIEFEN